MEKHIRKRNQILRSDFYSQLQQNNEKDFSADT